MKAQVIKKENSKVTLEIEVSAEKFEAAVQKVYLKDRKQFNIQGFRKGKTPRKIIEARYGEGVFYEGAFNMVFPEAYDEAIEEYKIEAIDRPDVDVKEFVKGQSVVFTAEVAVKPEVELGEYKGIEVEKVEYNVNEEEVEAEIKKMQESNARVVEVEDRAVKEGDIVTMDYAGFVGEEQFEGGTAENQTLKIGSKRFIPGFEEQLVGKNKKEELEVNVTFPEEYHSENLAGKEAIFKVTIHEIKEEELPEVDDEFAKDVSEFDTIAELKADIKTKLEEQAKAKEKSETESKIIDTIVDAVEIDVPEVLVKREIDFQIRNFEQSLSAQGIKLEQYLELTNSTIEEAIEQIRPVAEKTAKVELVLEAISEKEEIKATEDELDKELEQIAKQYNQELESLRKRLRAEDLDSVRVNIVRRKTIELLVENTKLV